MKSMLGCILILFCYRAVAQTDSLVTPVKIYKAVIKDAGGQNHYGSLLYITDSTTVLNTRNTKTQAPGILQSQTVFPFSKVESIELQRKGSVGRGLLWGGVTGAALGIIIGFVSGDDPPRQSNPGQLDLSVRLTAPEKALFLGILGGGGGTAVGAIIGALAKKTFIIGGKKENHDLYRQTVLEMTNAGKSRH